MLLVIVQCNYWNFFHLRIAKSKPKIIQKCLKPVKREGARLSGKWKGYNNSINS